MMHFASPWAFILLLLPFLCYRFFPPIKGLHGDALRLPFINDLRKIFIGGSLWQNVFDKKVHFNRLVIPGLIWLTLVCAAARPQWQGEPVRIKNEGRDILLVVDISTSMLEPDFSYQGRRITRLSAVKGVINDFIAKRTEDRLGLILFGTRAYLQAPITFDKKSVGEILWNTEAGMAGDTTAIGDALGMALKTLKDSPKKDKKVVILLTDGESNDGSLSMAEAVKLASEEKIKIYTVGVGAPQAFFNSFFGIKLGGAALDEASLKKLAAATKGNYFRAENTGELLKIYQTIDSLEASSGEENYITEVKELYYMPLLAAVLLCLALAFWQRRAV